MRGLTQDNAYGKEKLRPKPMTDIALGKTKYGSGIQTEETMFLGWLRKTQRECSGLNLDTESN